MDHDFLGLINLVAEGLRVYNDNNLICIADRKVILFQNPLNDGALNSVFLE